MRRNRLLTILSGVARTYYNKVHDTQAANLIGYWMLDEAVGTSGAGSVRDYSVQANHGTPSNVTFGATGIGDGRTAASFNGTTSNVNMSSSGILADIDPTAGTVAIWAKVSAVGVWTDTATRNLYQFSTEDEGSTYIGAYKTEYGATKCVDVECRLGGTWKFVIVPTTTTAWFHIAMTWSKTLDEVKVYFNGEQSGTTQTGLGVPSGARTRALIGAGSVGDAYIWSGSLAHLAVWNTPLSAAQIASIASILPPF